MATTRQKQAKRAAEVTRLRADHTRNLDERRGTLEASAEIPEKGTAAAEFSTITGQNHRTTIGPRTLAVAMAQRPETLLELPVVDKKGKVSAAWFRAGAIIAVVDLTGMRSFPR